jgi:hypothetical protein
MEERGQRARIKNDGESAYSCAAHCALERLRRPYRSETPCSLGSAQPCLWLLADLASRLKTCSTRMISKYGALHWR